MPVVQGFTITLADRVREQTQTTGTGTYSLDGAVSGFRSFQAAITTGQRTAYTAVLGASFEIGIGTVVSGAPATISRDLILRSSNGTNPVSWASGVKEIFGVAPAGLLNQVEPPGTPTAHTHTVSEITNLVVPDISICIVGRKVTVFTTSGTWTRDTKCLGARVRAVGGGGAGGGASATGSGQFATGGGGAGGEYAEGYFTKTQLTASRTITIPSAALGDTGGGANGGTVSFGSLMTCLGGPGGDLGQTGAGVGGIPSAHGTGGYFRAHGSAGGRGRIVGGGQITAGNLMPTNYGGASLLGGSIHGSVATDGLNGLLYGGGGAGAGNDQNSATAKAGGDGAPGIVIVEEDLGP